MKIAPILVLVACGTSPPVPPESPPPVHVLAAKPPPFQPTAFAVTVAGEGRPVVLIPGLGCPGSVWDATVAHLHAQTHVVTLAGFAGQPPIDGPVIAAARAELVHYIRDRHLEHPVIVGHSLGGMLALAVAADLGADAGPTIVVDASPVIDPATDPVRKQSAAKAMRDQMIAAPDGDFAEAVRQMFAGMTTSPPRLRPVVDAVLKSDRKTFATAFYDLFALDLRPEVGKISAPVLFVLAGDKPKDVIENEVLAIAHHDTRVVPNTKHFVMLDDPDGFFAVIDPFLSAHP